MSASVKVEDLYSIKDKVALVTGGTQGIGYMIARAYVENGARVYITARTESACSQVAEELSILGHCVAIPSDVSTDEGRETIYATLTRDEGCLDVLVNNAGIALGGDDRIFENFPAEAYDKVMDVNARAPFMLAQKLLGLLEVNATANSPGKIINMGSGAGIKVVNHKLSCAGSYGPSKALLHALTRDWAVFLASRHITVNAIAAGLFPSGMVDDPEFLDYAANLNPLKRAGTPQDMAGIAIYLASDASNYITGAIIQVDGGYTL